MGAVGGGLAGTRDRQPVLAPATTPLAHPLVRTGGDALMPSKTLKLISLNMEEDQQAQCCCGLSPARLPYLLITAVIWFREISINLIKQLPRKALEINTRNNVITASERASERGVRSHEWEWCFEPVMCVFMCFYASASDQCMPTIVSSNGGTSIIMRHCCLMYCRFGASSKNHPAGWKVQ